MPLNIPTRSPDWSCWGPTTVGARSTTNPLPPVNAAMNVQSHSDFTANWDRQVGCPDQYEPAASAAVWREMLASDPVGSTWGTGVRRAPQVPTWGFNQAIVGENADALPDDRWLYPARVIAEHDRPVRVTTDRRGYVGGAVVQAAGPWRTSGSWWRVGQSGQDSVRAGWRGARQWSRDRETRALFWIRASTTVRGGRQAWGWPAPGKYLESRRMGRVAERWRGLSDLSRSRDRRMVYRRDLRLTRAQREQRTQSAEERFAAHPSASCI